MWVLLFLRAEKKYHDCPLPMHSPSRLCGDGFDLRLISTWNICRKSFKLKWFPDRLLWNPHCIFRCEVWHVHVCNHWCKGHDDDIWSQTFPREAAGIWRSTIWQTKHRLLLWIDWYYNVSKLFKIYYLERHRFAKLGDCICCNFYYTNRKHYHSWNSYAVAQNSNISQPSERKVSLSSLHNGLLWITLWLQHLLIRWTGYIYKLCARILYVGKIE